jgi:glyceraldehyde 3-phosphate dehydrogenase
MTTSAGQGQQALSIIPTTPGAASAVGEVIPELKGKLDGLAVRVPPPMFLWWILPLNWVKTASAEQINDAFQRAAETYLKGILRYTDEELVSGIITARSVHPWLTDR